MPPDLQSSRDCKSRSIWIESRKPLSTTVCSDGLVLTPTQPFEEPYGKERLEREGWRTRRTGELQSWIVLCSPPPWGCTIYRGRGQPVPLHEGYQGGGQREVGQALGHPPPTTKTLGRPTNPYPVRGRLGLEGLPSGRDPLRWNGFYY
jgi:hypothetical protein